MKRHLIVAVFLLLIIRPVHGQVYLDFSQLEKTQNVTLKLRTIDKTSGEPLSYVSVYLIPQKDTVITYFALTDDKGKVSIDKIIPGKYSVNAELIGYKTFSKEYDLKGWSKDLGDIEMEENPEYIDAATITAVGNPIVIKKDTVEYNASAFRVADNAMLEDLLKKMPGMEVADDGTVKVNGEKVEKITVGGKTFFFDDPSMAVKNLPAKIVDKIKVINKDKDVAAFTRVSTNSDKEKVMDVQLKEEYKRGWFGNARLDGGSTLESDRILYTGSGMLSLYGEKNQLTIIGNARNAERPDEHSMVVYGNGDEDELAWKQGLTTSAQAGANLNSTSLKGTEINASVNYNYNKKDVQERSITTSFMGDAPDIQTDAQFNGTSEGQNLKAAFAINNIDKSKYVFIFRPLITYDASNSAIDNSSSTASEGNEKNSSNSSKVSNSNSLNPSFRANAGIKDFGKEGRSLMLYLTGDYKIGRGNSIEKSLTRFEDGSTSGKDLLFDSNSSANSTYSDFYYTEPISKNWKALVSVSSTVSNSSSTRNAFNAADGSSNIFYSTLTKNTNYTINEDILLQYQKDDFNAVVGISGYHNQNITDSENRGEKFSVGKNIWTFDWAPSIEFRFNKEGHTFRAGYDCSNAQPSARDITPTLDLSNPVRVTLGNTFLRPRFQHYSYIHYNRNNPKLYSFLSIYMYNTLGFHDTVYANWFDANGVRYAMPANATTPTISNYFSTEYSIPFGKEKHFKFDVSANASYSKSISYQSVTSSIPAIDRDNFDYDALIRDIWGDASGDRFYSGQSGFAESNTNTLSYRAYTGLSYNGEHLEVTGGAFAANSITKYSLDPRADMNTWDFNLASSIALRTESGWNFKTKGTYYFYRGYSAGYGDPNFIWNMGISKQLGSITLSLNAYDILNQKKSLNRSTSAEYVMDSYSNILGRFFLAGITFNFGKMNAKNNETAQRAMFDMAF